MQKEIDEFLAALGAGQNLENLETLESAEEMVRNGASLKEVVRHMKNKGLGIGMKPTAKGLALQFDIIVKRPTQTIAAPLPYMIFGNLESERAYKNILLPNLPAGVTLTSVTVTDGVYTFTYSDGTHTDTITVQCAQNTYSIIVKSLLLNKISIRALKLSVPTTDYLTQFDQPINWTVRTPFGKTKSQDSITPSSLIDTDQNQQRIVDINKPSDIHAHFLAVDAETTIWGYVNQNVPSYTLSMFIDNYDRKTGIH